MPFTDEEAKSALRQRGLRVTPQRMAVVRALASGQRPLSQAEVSSLSGSAGLDKSTVYRNLMRLIEAGVAYVVNHSGGAARYALLDITQGNAHVHPHFLCRLCGQVSCLLDQVIDRRAAGRAWGPALNGAAVQFHGECPGCRHGNA